MTDTFRENDPQENSGSDDNTKGIVQLLSSHQQLKEEFSSSASEEITHSFADAKSEESEEEEDEEEGESEENSNEETEEEEEEEYQNPKIPKIIHFVWAGGKNPMRDDHLRTVLRWAIDHPDFKIYLWVDKKTWPKKNDYQDKNIFQYYQNAFPLVAASLDEEYKKRLEDFPELVKKHDTHTEDRPFLKKSKEIEGEDEEDIIPEDIPKNFSQTQSAFHNIHVKDIDDNLFDNNHAAPAHFYKTEGPLARRYANYEISRLRPNYGASSDTLRYCILYMYGGAYFDGDINPHPVNRLDAPPPPMEHKKAYGEKVEFDKENGHVIYVQTHTQGKTVIGNDGFICTPHNPCMRDLLRLSLSNYYCSKTSLKGAPKLRKVRQGSMFLSGENCPEHYGCFEAQAHAYDNARYMEKSTVFRTGPMAVENIVGPAQELNEQFSKVDGKHKKYGKVAPLGVWLREPYGANTRTWVFKPISRYSHEEVENLIDCILDNIEFEAHAMGVLRLEDHVQNFFKALGFPADPPQYEQTKKKGGENDEKENKKTDEEEEEGEESEEEEHKKKAEEEENGKKNEAKDEKKKQSQAYYLSQFMGRLEKRLESKKRKTKYLEEKSFDQEKKIHTDHIQVVQFSNTPQINMFYQTHHLDRKIKLSPKSYRKNYTALKWPARSWSHKALRTRHLTETSYAKTVWHSRNGTGLQCHLNVENSRKTLEQMRKGEGWQPGKKFALIRIKDQHDDKYVCLTRESENAEEQDIRQHEIPISICEEFYQPEDYKKYPQLSAFKELRNKFNKTLAAVIHCLEENWVEEGKHYDLEKYDFEIDWSHLFHGVQEGLAFIETTLHLHSNEMDTRYLQELEMALKTHEQALDACHIPIDDRSGKERKMAEKIKNLNERIKQCKGKVEGRIAQLKEKEKKRIELEKKLMKKKIKKKRRKKKEMEEEESFKKDDRSDDDHKDGNAGGGSWCPFCPNGCPLQ